MAQKVDIDVSYGRVGEIIREFRPLIANTPARGIRNNLEELTNCDNFNAPNFICAIELAEHELVNRWIPEGANVLEFGGRCSQLRYSVTGTGIGDRIVTGSDCSDDCADYGAFYKEIQRFGFELVDEFNDCDTTRTHAPPGTWCGDFIWHYAFQLKRER